MYLQETKFSSFGVEKFFSRAIRTHYLMYLIELPSYSALLDLLAPLLRRRRRRHSLIRSFNCILLRMWVTASAKESERERVSWRVERVHCQGGYELCLLARTSSSSSSFFTIWIMSVWTYWTTARQLWVPRVPKQQWKKIRPCSWFRETARITHQSTKAGVLKAPCKWLEAQIPKTPAKNLNSLRVAP